MKFNTFRTRIGDNQIRHRNVLESEECMAVGFISAQQQQELIKILAETPTLQICGKVPFQKMKMEWNGMWRIEMEAVYEGPE